MRLPKDTSRKLTKPQKRAYDLAESFLDFIESDIPPGEDAFEGLHRWVKSQMPEFDTDLVSFIIHEDGQEIFERHMCSCPDDNVMFFAAAFHRHFLNEGHWEQMKKIYSERLAEIGKITPVDLTKMH